MNRKLLIDLRDALHSQDVPHEHEPHRVARRIDELLDKEMARKLDNFRP